MRELITQLEQLTAEVETADPADQDRVACLLEKRGALVTQLTANPGALDDAARDAMLRARDAGQRLLDRLRVKRAARRDELGRLHHSGCLLRVLDAERRPIPHLDCRG
jgi:hypothetical protein